jgi:universal stress protein F
MYNTILVPVDPSQMHSGINAIKIAKKLIDDSGNILLVSVLDKLAVLDKYPTHVGTELPDNVRENARKQTLAELKNIAKENGIGSKVEIRSGHAANSILLAAEEHNADLIIIASHRPGLSDYFLGSTAARVVRHAQCPVLVDR